MTMLRQPYYELSPEIYNALVQASKALESCALEPTLTELIYLRVSQINGCAFCLEMHSKALRKSGVAQAKLDALAGWRVSHHFSAKEISDLTFAISLMNCFNRLAVGMRM